MGFDPVAPLARHGLVRQPRRLRQERTVAATGEDDIDRGFDADLVPRRDKERFVPGARADRGADDLTAIDERRVGAEDALRFLVLADEPALGAADCRPLQNQSQMGCQPKSAGMGIALTVEEEDVRLDPEIAAGGKHRWRLPE